MLDKILQEGTTELIDATKMIGYPINLTFNLIEWFSRFKCSSSNHESKAEQEKIKEFLE